MAYTAEQFKEAARKAYAAGDVAAARKLISRAKTAEGIQGVSDHFQGVISGQIEPPQPAQQFGPTFEDAPEYVKSKLKTEQYYRDNPESSVIGAAGGLAQGGTFGLGSRAIAAARALSPNITYDQALGFEHGRFDAARENTPIAAYGGEIVGAVASPINKLLPGVGGSTLGQRAASGAKSGAVGALLYDLGTGKGDIEERAKSAASSAMLGGALGAAAPYVVAGGKAVYNKAIADPISAISGGASPERAGQYVSKLIERSGKSADDIQASILSASKEGQPEYVLADALGNPGQRALAGIARQPGNARTAIVDALTTRQDNQASRIGGFLSDAMGTSDTAAARRAADKAARSAQAKALYGEADDLAAPVNLNKAIGVIDDLLGRDPILQDGSSLVSGAFGKKLSELRGQLQNGGEQLIDFKRVRDIKSDLFTMMQSNPKMKAQFNPVYKALDEALEASSAGYRAANDSYRAASNVIDQFDVGANAARSATRAADNVPAYNALGPQEKAAFRAGYIDPIMAKVEASAPGVNKARPLMADKFAQELGAMDQSGMIGPRISREGKMFETANAALGGSKTADNLADLADQGLGSGVLINLLTGNLRTAAMQAGQKIAEKATGKSEGTKELIAKALLGGDVNSTLSPYLQSLDKNNARSAIVEAIISRAIRPALP